ncbi:MAG: putative glycoside hydrolase, partial [Candidatus Paceibacterota bacterium]
VHKKKIYIVGRIAVFQDLLMVKTRPDLAVKKASDKTVVWGDRKNIHWIDTGSIEHWNYIVTLAKEAYNFGFDELNFDYIRFPSDGDMKDIYFPISEGKNKAIVLESFFSYLHDQMQGTGAKLSADLFGETTVRTDNDSIGQVLERAMPYFDYISPMVYPSHYTYNFAGLGDPNKHPYEVVKYCMDEAVKRTIATSTVVSVMGYEYIASSTPKLYTKPAFDKNKMRPWLQDNNYPVTYTPAMVRAQIQATYDSGLNSWMLWNAGNRYTKEALIGE